MLINIGFGRAISKILVNMLLSEKENINVGKLYKNRPFFDQINIITFQGNSLIQVEV